MKICTPCGNGLKLKALENCGLLKLRGGTFLGEATIS
jgi:hypothetical protein